MRCKRQEEQERIEGLLTNFIEGKIATDNVRKDQFKERSLRPSREELVDLYHKQKLTQDQIGEIYGVMDRTVLRWMRSYQIKSRTSFEVKHPASFKKPSKEELYRLYYEQGFTTTAIAEQYGVARGTVFRWMEGYGITLRNQSEAKHPHGIKKPSKAELTKLGIQTDFDLEEIAEKHSVSVWMIRKWLDEYKIEYKIKRIPLGRWSDLKFTLNAARIFLERNNQYENLPSQKVLIRVKNSSLAGAICKYHGGFPAFRKELNTYLGRQNNEERTPSLLEEWVNG